MRPPQAVEDGVYCCCVYVASRASRSEIFLIVAGLYCVTAEIKSGVCLFRDSWAFDLCAHSQSISLGVMGMRTRRNCSVAPKRGAETGLPLEKFLKGPGYIGYRAYLQQMGKLKPRRLTTVCALSLLSRAIQP